MSTQSYSRPYMLGTSALFLGSFLLLAALLVRDTTLGWPTALIDRWYFSVAGVAFLVFGISARREAAEFGVLAFFLIVGGAAQLYLTDPVAFPALRIVPRTWKDAMMILVLAGEAAAAIAVLRRIGAEALIAGARRLGLGRLGLLVIVTGFLSVPILGFMARNAGLPYLAHIVLGGALTTLHLTLMASMALVHSPISGLYRLTALAPAAVAFFASLILNFMAFEAIPHSTDEVAYQFQSRLFAGGALTAPAPPDAALAGLDHPPFAIQDGRMGVPVDPGWPLVLAAGAAVGAPWLINPLLAALSVLLAHAIASRLAGRDEADLVAMMMGASPWLVAMGASLMPQVQGLALMLLSWWLGLKALESPARERVRMILAGGAMGGLVMTLPAEGLLVAALTLGWLATSARGSAQRAGLFAAGAAGPVALLALWNLKMTGHPLVLAIRAWRDRVWGVGLDRFGFGPDLGRPGDLLPSDLWPGHSPAEGLIDVLTLTSNLATELLGWSIGSFALVLCFLLWQRPSRADMLMAGLVAAIAALFFFYWAADSGYIGPRRWFLMLFPLLFLSARGYQAIRARFPDQAALAFVRIDSLLWYACIFGLCVFLPWRAVTKYYEFADFHPTVIEDAARGSYQDKVVLARPNGDPGATLMLNDPWLRGTVWLVDTGTMDEGALAAAFPGKPVVRYENDWTGR